MTVSEIIAEIKDRAQDGTLQDSVLLTKINNEYDQTNLAITNLNEDYFFAENAAFAITSSQGPYTLHATFSKMRALITPSSGFVNQVSPADPRKPYGWYFSGTTAAGLKTISFTDTPQETGSYKLRSVDYPAHLDQTTYLTPLWPAPFHEILVLGALKRVYSVQDIYDKFPDLKADLAEMKKTLLEQVGGLNLGANREVQADDEDFE
jgi:hypothetical protein